MTILLLQSLAMLLHEVILQVPFMLLASSCCPQGEHMHCTDGKSSSICF